MESDASKVGAVLFQMSEENHQISDNHLLLAMRIQLHWATLVSCRKYAKFDATSRNTLIDSLANNSDW